jgi:hypothetical protein
MTQEIFRPGSRRKRQVNRHSLGLLPQDQVPSVFVDDKSRAWDGRGEGLFVLARQQLVAGAPHNEAGAVIVPLSVGGRAVINPVRDSRYARAGMAAPSWTRSSRYHWGT